MDRDTRIILYGPVGNWIYEQVTKTDFDRQMDTVKKMKENGMEHGKADLTSKREVIIGDNTYTQQHDGKYTW